MSPINALKKTKSLSLVATTVITVQRASINKIEKINKKTKQKTNRSSGIKMLFFAQIFPLESALSKKKNVQKCEK